MKLIMNKKGVAVVFIPLLIAAVWAGIWFLLLLGPSISLSMVIKENGTLMIILLVAIILFVVLKKK